MSVADDRDSFTTSRVMKGDNNAHVKDMEAAITKNWCGYLFLGLPGLSHDLALLEHSLTKSLLVL